MKPPEKDREWTELELQLLDPNKPLPDPNKKQAVLKCLYCDKHFKFEDQVTVHIWRKHRNHFLHEILHQRREIAELQKALKVYRDLAKEPRK